jgi:hypothetical protein
MADRDSPQQLPGTLATNGSARQGGIVARQAQDGRPALNGRAAGKSMNGPKRDSDDIVAEIERTRQNLARTIDTLADRVSPSGNVRRLRERAAEQMTKPEVQLAAVAIALAAAGVTIYRIWGRRKS